MFSRAARLPPPGKETFFLWGPRQTGKTTLLRESYVDAFWVDLLKAEEYRRYLQNPERLREELTETSVRQVVIDEVQKVLQLLDEVHWLMEHRAIAFALCGSSARKVKRGATNLLGGRAVRRELHGLTGAEIGSDFDLDHPRVGQRVIVCLEPRTRRTEDGILVLPAREFCRRLSAGDLF